MLNKQERGSAVAIGVLLKVSRIRLKELAESSADDGVKSSLQNLNSCLEDLDQACLQRPEVIKAPENA